jgi:hypothetical protein
MGSFVTSFPKVEIPKCARCGHMEATSICMGCGGLMCCGTCDYNYHMYYPVNRLHERIQLMFGGSSIYGAATEIVYHVVLPPVFGDSSSTTVSSSKPLPITIHSPTPTSIVRPPVLMKTEAMDEFEHPYMARSSIYNIDNDSTITPMVTPSRSISRESTTSVVNVTSVVLSDTFDTTSRSTQSSPKPMRYDGYFHNDRKSNPTLVTSTKSTKSTKKFQWRPSKTTTPAITTIGRRNSNDDIVAPSNYVVVPNNVISPINGILPNIRVPISTQGIKSARALYHSRRRNAWSGLSSNSSIVLPTTLPAVRQMAQHRNHYADEHGTRPSFNSVVRQSDLSHTKSANMKKKLVAVSAASGIVISRTHEGVTPPPTPIPASILPNASSVSMRTISPEPTLVTSNMPTAYILPLMAGPPEIMNIEAKASLVKSDIAKLETAMSTETILENKSSTKVKEGELKVQRVRGQAKIFTFHPYDVQRSAAKVSTPIENSSFHSNIIPVDVPQLVTRAEILKGFLIDNPYEPSSPPSYSPRLPQLSHPPSIPLSPDFA